MFETVESPTIRVMRFIFNLILAFVVSILACSCYRNTIQEVVVDVPEMSGQACFDAINQKLAGLKISPKDTSRLRSVTPDLMNRKIRVVYDSMNLSSKNIEYAIAEAGFTANGVQPYGKRPEGCQ